MTSTLSELSTGMVSLDVKKDFPILATQMRGKPLTYLDNGATTQKPAVVIEALETYYKQDNANIHRGVYEISERATAQYEAARQKMAAFIHAEQASEVVFTRGTTEGINLVAQSFLRPQLLPGDEILISHMEHHSNIVPWQILCEQTGAVLKVIPMNHSGELDLDAFQALMTDKTKMLAIVHLSNALGTINPIEHMIEEAHQCGIPVLVDGAQAVSHMPVDVTALAADFYVFSGHKMYGPTGIGVLYGKKTLLDAMPPYHGGGDMIKQVCFEGSTYADAPQKFEAGTPHIAGAIGLGVAADYLQNIGMEKIAAYEKALLDYATEKLSAFPGLTIIGNACEKSSIISFTLDFAHPHDISSILDFSGVAIRAGHHCAMPVMAFYDVPATARMSLGIYNDKEDIDRLIEALFEVKKVFG